MGAPRRDFTIGCARRSPERSPKDAGSIPATSTAKGLVALEFVDPKKESDQAISSVIGTARFVASQTGQ
jgi:hypothetical protein